MIAGLVNTIEPLGATVASDVMILGDKAVEWKPYGEQVLEMIRVK